MIKYYRSRKTVFDVKVLPFHILKFYIRDLSFYAFLGNYMLK